MVNADELLSILRGTAPPPVSSPKPAPAVPVHSLPPPPPPSSDLDRLFNRAFTNSHPSNPPSQPIEVNQSTSIAVIDIKESTGAVEEKTNKQQSASLLSLLQNISAPSLSSPPSAASPPTPIAKNENSMNLLAQLMGSSLPPVSKPIIQQQQVQNVPTSKMSAQPSSSSAVEAKASSSKPPVSVIPVPPAFTFVSPFDLLSQSTETFVSSNYNSSSVPAPTPVPVVNEEPVTPTSVVSSPVTALLTVVTSPVTTPAPIASANRSLLASTLLAAIQADSPPSPTPSYAPQGVHIPLHTGNKASVSETLRIDLGEEHLESLSLGKVIVQPVTIFPSEMKWGRGRKVAMWENALVYSNAGGKIRVIDRATGARLLLKGHTSKIIELVVSPNVDIVEGEETRIVASIGADGRLIIWRVGNQSINQGLATSKKIVDIQNSNYTLVKISPNYPADPTVLLVKQYHGVLVFDLKAAEGATEQISLSETLVSIHRGEVIDVDFSPDGSKFAILAEDIGIMIHSTSNPRQQLEAIPLPDHSQFSGIHLQDDSVIISWDEGTEYLTMKLATKTTPHAAHHTSFFAPEPYNLQQHFGQSCYHIPSRTLFISSSLRGSLFALALSKDASRISHVLEIATPDPIIGFFLDGSSTDSSLTALCLHPEGINLITFEHKRQGTTPSSPVATAEELEEDRTGRRMSLESSILVESQTQVKVDEADPEDSTVPSVKSDRTVQRRPSVNPVPEEEVVEVKLEPVVEISPSATSATILSSSPSTSSAMNSAIKSLKAKNGKPVISTSSSPATIDERTIKQESPAPTTISSETIANMWAAGGSGAGSSNTNGSKKNVSQGSSVEVMKELKRIEESIPSRVSKLIAKELEKINIKSAEEKSAAEATELARQEASFRVLSASLSKITTKQLETSVKEQIKVQVVPSIAHLVSTAVSDQVARGVDLALRESLPNELERLLYRPELTTHLARNFSTAIGPSLENNITKVVVSTVIPLVTKSIQSAFESLNQTIRFEMVEVRKSIVKEQGGALESTEREVLFLKEEMKNMKVTLARMESLISSTSSSSSRRAASSSQSQHVPENYVLPVIPRAESPPESYEITFTNALQPSNEPEFVSLLHLINSSPATRMDAVFPAQPAKPRISPPVILSLAYRLGTVIQNKVGKLDDEGKKQLQYLRKCINALDGMDPETAAYTPRILESVAESLSIRGKAAMGIADARGVEELRKVENFCRARFNLISQRTQR